MRDDARNTLLVLATKKADVIRTFRRRRRRKKEAKAKLLGAKLAERAPNAKAERVSCRKKMSPYFT